MKVVDPSSLLRDAAFVLQGVNEEVVVVGAAALEVALASAPAKVEPTRDVDLAVSVTNAEKVIAHLEAAELTRSDAPHEEPFTWVRGNLKVQLMRPFHPFPGPLAKRLPENPAMSAALRPQHQDEVAFSDAPDELRLVVVNAACLAALKQKAFGRTRPPGDAVVERDFYDAYQLFQHVPEELLETYERAEGDVRGRVRKAAELLGAGDIETGFAARQMVRLGEASNQQDAELQIIRLSRQFSRRL